MSELDKKHGDLKAEKRRTDQSYRQSVNTNARRWYRKAMDDPVYVAKRRVSSSKRRKAQVAATPSWLTDEHWEEISDIYLLAAIKNAEETEAFYEVDHIVPLRGVDADGDHICSGLHVPWNLEILSRYENRSKGSSLPEESQLRLVIS